MDRTDEDTSTVDMIGRIMDKAATADRRALFAGLQAAVAGITDVGYRGKTMDQAFGEVERRLDLGMEYGGEFR